MFVMWFDAAMNPPSVGRFSVPDQSLRVIARSIGRTTCAMPRYARLDLAGGCTGADATRPVGGDTDAQDRSTSVRSGRRELPAELRTQRLELLGEALVAPVDQADPADRRGALGRQGGDQVAEPAAQVRHLDVAGTQRRGSRDD